MLLLPLVPQKVYLVQVPGIYVGSGIKSISASTLGSNGKCNLNTFFRREGWQ